MHSLNLYHRIERNEIKGEQVKQGILSGKLKMVSASYGQVGGQEMSSKQIFKLTLGLTYFLTFLLCS